MHLCMVQCPVAASSAPLLKELDQLAALRRPRAKLQAYPALCPEQSRVHWLPMKVSSRSLRSLRFSVTNSVARILFLSKTSQTTQTVNTFSDVGCLHGLLNTACQLLHLWFHGPGSPFA